MGIYIKATALVDVGPGLFSCRPVEIDAGSEPPMLLVLVDESAQFEYGAGEREYRVLGEIDSQEFKPVKQEAKTSVRLHEPRLATTTEISGYVAVFDWTGV